MSTSTRPRASSGRSAIGRAWVTSGWSISPRENTVNDSAIRLRGVTKAFAGHTAVKDLSLDVPRGSVFGLLGPNGAGKTTTLRMVMNVLGPDSGTLEILGQPADHAA